MYGGEGHEHLQDLRLWTQAPEHFQDAIITRLALFLEDEFDLLPPKNFRCQENSYRLGRFRLRSLDMNFHLIPGGSFLMGSATGAANEGPLHEVKIRPFLIAECAVTQRQWDLGPTIAPIAEEKPSNPVARIARKVTERFNSALLSDEPLTDNRLFDGVDIPAHGLSNALIRSWLAQHSQRLRLPSEAEWEFACKAGTDTDYYWGSAPIDKYCWSASNSQAHPHKVYNAPDACNAFGLQNILGNVLECVADDYLTDYQQTPVNGDPAVDSSSEWSVARGGSWFDSPEMCRSYTRRRIQKSRRAYFLGLRLAVHVSDWLMSP
ncbi:MAG: formylglycine-generating enzyme family protein [Planctomycetota bacterium]|nr:formylglycine-generating enzyme family protein [Planctomycetota bacterium]